jgi:DNA/RNA-binding domain of Phe-tRNA-synthetase-like protein
MELIVEKEIFAVFPDFVGGILIAEGIDNSPIPEELSKLCKSVEDEVRKKFPTPESLKQHPLIIRWQQAYKKFGADPHRYRPSSEALAKQVLKGNDICGINTLVDIYNYISLKYILPVGGEDIDSLRGNLRLCFAKGDEPFLRIGGSENEPPFAGEVIYRDDEGVVCRMWNWREGDRTKLTEGTKNAVVVIDALAPAGEKIVREALNEMAGLVQKYCGGSVTTSIVKGEE